MMKGILTGESCVQLCRVRWNFLVKSAGFGTTLRERMTMKNFWYFFTFHVNVSPHQSSDFSGDYLAFPLSLVRVPVSRGCIYYLEVC